MEELFPELAERFHGPFSARLFLQPCIALFFAIRDGIRDGREGADPYIWALVFKSGERRDRIQQAWASAGKVAIMAFALDCLFQYVASGGIRIVEAAAMALILCVIPYTLVRGPASRATRALRR